MLQKCDKIAKDTVSVKQRAHQAAAEACALQTASESAALARNRKLQAEDEAIAAAACLAAEKEKVAKTQAVKVGDQEADEVRKLACLAETDASDANFLVKKAQELQAHADAVKRKVATEQAKQLAEQALTAAVEHKNAVASADNARTTEGAIRDEVKAADEGMKEAQKQVDEAVEQRTQTLGKWKAYDSAVSESWNERGATKSAQQSAVASAWLAAQRSQEAAEAETELQKAVNLKSYFDNVIPAHNSLREANGQLYAVRVAEDAQADLAQKAYNEMAANSIRQQASNTVTQATMEAQQVNSVRQKMEREWDARKDSVQETLREIQATRERNDAQADATHAAVNAAMSANLEEEISLLNHEQMDYLEANPPAIPPPPGG